MRKITLPISDEFYAYAMQAAKAFGYPDACDYLAATLNTAILAAMDELHLILPDTHEDRPIGDPASSSSKDESDDGFPF